MPELTTWAAFVRDVEAKISEAGHDPATVKMFELDVEMGQKGYTVRVNVYSEAGGGQSPYLMITEA